MDQYVRAVSVKDRMQYAKYLSVYAKDHATLTPRTQFLLRSCEVGWEFYRTAEPVSIKTLSRITVMISSSPRILRLRSSVPTWVPLYLGRQNGRNLSRSQTCTCPRTFSAASPWLNTMPVCLSRLRFFLSRKTKRDAGIGLSDQSTRLNLDAYTTLFPLPLGRPGQFASAKTFCYRINDAWDFWSIVPCTDFEYVFLLASVNIISPTTL